MILGANPLLGATAEEELLSEINLARSTSEKTRENWKDTYLKSPRLTTKGGIQFNE